MLPFGLSFHDVRIRYSTAGLTRIRRTSFEFRLTRAADVITLETARQLIPSEDYALRQKGGETLIISHKPATLAEHLKVRFREGYGPKAPHVAACAESRF